MLAWYRQQVKSFGIVGGTRLLTRVALSRSRVSIINRFLTPTIVCPCCGWQGRRLHDYIEVGYSVRNSSCPQCESQHRHRLLYLWLSTNFDLTSKSGIAVVFAKEKALAPLWEQAKHLNSIFVDIEPSRGTDLLADLRNLPFESDSIDLIWCHHVLEHIEDDRAAIREIYRVLRPSSGAAILSVPMKPCGETEEYGFPDPNISHHWRIYGEDFAERLEAGGLTVQRIDFGLSPEDSRRYAISEEPVYLCTRVCD